MKATHLTDPEFFTLESLHPREWRRIHEFEFGHEIGGWQTGSEIVVLTRLKGRGIVEESEQGWRLTGFGAAVRHLNTPKKRRR